ncbi:insulinase family protein [Ancylothrix sp. C2]|uniref:M16 family metallopeptidase n=1 Tax=Ancylothrix sp. D3o TaxID=2953691 RepID=UPI0021BAF66E|nr:pitrilysin family protein [Ancylothrix sp. D3o]MCT7949692.1 insulinase family protein [Ancylothrix sp. D3o]
MVQSPLNRIVHRTVLDNGLVILFVENPAADIIACRMFIRAGTLKEPPGFSGLAHLLAAVITKGTDTLTSLEIAEKVESVGASLGADTAADYFLFSLKTVSADFPDLLDLAGQLLRNPSFPEAEVELERRLTLRSIRSQQEQPFAIAFDRLRQAMYLNHPYSFSSLGTEETVSQLTAEDLHNYHQTYFRPDNMVISLAGRLSPEEAVRLVEKSFGDWQNPPVLLPDLSLPFLTPQPQQILIEQETQQSIVILGYLAPSVRRGEAMNANPSDYAALKLLNTYLGNGLSSRLFVELREKRGLAYEVSALFPTRLEASQFAVYMGTAPENTTVAVNGLRAEVDRLCHTKLSDEELRRSKNKLLGQYALGKQTNAQLAQIFGWYEILGLGIEFDTVFIEEISAITPTLAIDAACRYLSEPYISIVGPASALSPLSLALCP